MAKKSGFEKRDYRNMGIAQGFKVRFEPSVYEGFIIEHPESGSYYRSKRDPAPKSFKSLQHVYNVLHDIGATSFEVSTKGGPLEWR